MSFEQKASSISLILSDVDGVLTDGGIIFDNEGIETKRFHIRDGLGIKLWQRADRHFGIITGRSSNVVQIRTQELGVEIVRQGFEEKLPIVRELISDLSLSSDQVCYIGDDLPDIPAMQHVGLPVAVADAAIDVRNVATYITESLGGHGAVREVIERILRIQDRWAEAVRKFSSNVP